MNSYFHHHHLGDNFYPYCFWLSQANSPASIVQSHCLCLYSTLMCFLTHAVLTRNFLIHFPIDISLCPAPPNIEDILICFLVFGTSVVIIYEQSCSSNRSSISQNSTLQSTQLRWTQMRRNSNSTPAEKFYSLHSPNFRQMQ